MNDIDVIRRSQKTGKGGRLGVPQRCRNDAYYARGVNNGSSRKLWPPKVTGPKVRTILDKNVQTLFHRERRIEDNEPETQRKDVIASANLEEVANGTLEQKEGSSISLDLRRLV